MNKRKIFTAVSICALSAIGIFFGIINTENNTYTCDLSANVEAISSCEITKDNKTLLMCSGEKERCRTTKWGYTLECSGKKVLPED